MVVCRLAHVLDMFAERRRAVKNDTETETQYATGDWIQRLVELYGVDRSLDRVESTFSYFSVFYLVFVFKIFASVLRETLGRRLPSYAIGLDHIRFVPHGNQLVRRGIRFCCTDRHTAKPLRSAVGSLIHGFRSSLQRSRFWCG